MRAMTYLLLLALVGCSGKKEQKDPKERLIGSWQFGEGEDRVIYTYEADGTLLATAGDGVKDPKVRSRGSWRWLPDNVLEIEIPSHEGGTTLVRASKAAFLDEDTLELSNPKTGKKVTHKRLR